MQEHMQLRKHLQGVQVAPGFRKMVEREVMFKINNYKEVPPGLISYLNSKPKRLVWFIDNLSKELTHAIALRQLKSQREYKKQLLITAIHDFTKVFVDSCQMEADDKYQSDLERIRKQARVDLVKDMDATIAGKPQGEFEEAGLVTDENKVGERP